MSNIPEFIEKDYIPKYIETAFSKVDISELTVQDMVNAFTTFYIKIREKELEITSKAN